MDVERKLYELDDQDGHMWTRPLDAPRSVPWRPVLGDGRLHAKTKAEATRMLRREGLRVTRKHSGY